MGLILHLSDSVFNIEPTCEKVVDVWGIPEVAPSIIEPVEKEATHKPNVGLEKRLQQHRLVFPEIRQNLGYFYFHFGAATSTYCRHNLMGNRDISNVRV